MPDWVIYNTPNLLLNQKGRLVSENYGFTCRQAFINNFRREA
jgi:hypothetical protein